MAPEIRIAETVADYWDANREKSKDSAFWMAHPLCRQAINRRISGNPHEWPLDWFRRIHAHSPFGLGVSWGCGLGAFERAAIQLNLVREIDAFDISEASLVDARGEAERDHLLGINYQVGDFDDPRLLAKHYDVAFFHASLHHVSALERLFRRLVLGLKSRGAVYVDEYVGPSRFHWTRNNLLLAQSMLDLAPPEAKTRSEIIAPIETNDPSEAYRSDEIPLFLRTFFDIVEWKPYGGQVADLVFPCLIADWTHSDQGLRFIAAMLQIEDYELERDPATTHHLVACGRLKSSWRLAAPLGLQALRALQRRLFVAIASLRVRRAWSRARRLGPPIPETDDLQFERILPAPPHRNHSYGLSVGAEVSHAGSPRSSESPSWP